MLSSALLLAIRSLSAACAPLDVPSFDLIGFSSAKMPRPRSFTTLFDFPLVSMIVSDSDDGALVCASVDAACSDCCIGAVANGFAILPKAFLLAILNRSAARAPLDVPSFDLTGFSYVEKARPGFSH